MRICFATSEFPPPFGGIGNSADRITRGLCEKGFEVHIFVPGGDQDLGDQSALPEVLSRSRFVHRVPHARFCDVMSFYDRQINFTLFHGFELHMTNSCLPIANGRPVVASMRGIDSVRLLSDPYGQIAKPVLTNASWITAVSTAALTRACRIVDVSNRCSFIPNAVDPSIFRNWRLTPENAGIVGTVCMFRSKKNIPLLVRAYARVDATLRRQLLLVGGYANGGHAVGNPVEAAIQESELAKEVYITGPVERNVVANELLAMRVFVLSSDHEGMPNSILEAAACGVPIVSTAVDGVKDVFTNGANCLLVEAGDCDGLAMAITEVLQDEDLALHLSDGGRAVAHGLSEEREQDEWACLYHRLIRTS